MPTPITKRNTAQGFAKGDLYRVLVGVFNDLTEIHTQFKALTAKMDADFADVANASTDYAASVDPADLETSVGQS